MPAFVNLFLGIFIAIGLVIGAFGVQTVLRDRATAKWPLAAGQITQSTIITDNSGDGTSYKPEIIYRYTVNGKEFTGKRISFGTDLISSGGQFARRCTAKYPVGKEVRVAYQSEQPSVSALETGITRRSFLKVSFGLGFAFFGAWFRLIMWLVDS